VGTVLDIIGKVGENPAVGNNDGSQGGWNNIDSLHYKSSKYWWTPWTKDHTLIRKRNVRQGVNQNPEYFCFLHLHTTQITHCQLKHNQQLRSDV